MNYEHSLEQTEGVIKALAHRSRLVIVQEIGSGELCVSDLQRLVGSDISTVSKHLLVLKNAGIVETRKSGLVVYYRLRIPCIADFVTCIGAVMAGQPHVIPAAVIQSLISGTETVGSDDQTNSIADILT